MKQPVLLHWSDEASVMGVGEISLQNARIYP